LPHVAGKILVGGLVLLRVRLFVDQVGSDKLRNDLYLRLVEETRHKVGVQSAAFGQHLEHGGFWIAR
jgi:hypothetical protein